MRKATNASTAAVVDATEQSAAPTAPAANVQSDAVPAATSAPAQPAPPARGGSYVAQADGTLERRAATEEPGLIERVAAKTEDGNHG